MLNLIGNSVFSKLLWGMMALYLLNISVDVADLHPQHIPEDLSINDQESIVEIVLEKILGIENAIIEFDDHDNDDQNKKPNVKLNLFAPNIHSLIAHNNLTNKTSLQFPDLNAFLISGVQFLDIPPPKI